MQYDEIIDCNQYPTLKWSSTFLAEYFGDEEAIPMSVADMDLRAPKAVIAGLQKRVAHGIYGYEIKPESYFLAFESWYQARHGWQLVRKQLEPSPSILNAIAVLISQHSQEGEGVILHPPHKKCQLRNS